MTRMRVVMPKRVAIAALTATRFLRSFVLGSSDHAKYLFGSGVGLINVSRLDCVAGEGDGVVRATLNICG